MHGVERTDTTMNVSDMQRIAVVGAGLMGHGIALELAAHGFAVQLQDLDQAQLDRARDGITPDEAVAAPARITMGTDLRAAVTDADLVIEAVSEDLEVKRNLFRDLDA